MHNNVYNYLKKYKNAKKQKNFKNVLTIGEKYCKI